MQKGKHITEVRAIGWVQAWDSCLGRGNGQREAGPDWEELTLQKMERMLRYRLQAAACP